MRLFCRYKLKNAGELLKIKITKDRKTNEKVSNVRNQEMMDLFYRQKLQNSEEIFKIKTAKVESFFID